MTIDRAIEILQNELDHTFKASVNDYTSAITLGKQALERVREERKADLIPLPIPLPGETEA